MKKKFKIPEFVKYDIEVTDKEDLEYWRKAPMEEHDRVLGIVCKTAAAIVESREDKDRVLSHERDFPESSRAIWQRLRAKAK